jgi:hypothetical protein
MSTSLRTRPELFGLFELDEAGNVIYSRVESGGGPGGPPPDVAGRNFFAEVAAFENAEELRQRIEGFTRSGGHADNFHFDCRFDGDSLAVKVLLARVRERSDGNRTKSVLVHIRKI